MVAHSEIELKVGGRMRTHYDPKGTLGDPKTIENEVISYAMRPTPGSPLEPLTPHPLP